MEREENLVRAFAFFDKDGSGYITFDELQQACKDFGLDEVKLDEIISEIDMDNVRLSFYITHLHYKILWKHFLESVHYFFFSNRQLEWLIFTLSEAHFLIEIQTSNSFTMKRDGIQSFAHWCMS